MIYAKGNYDNTVSPSNLNPITIQSGFNTQDEMFVFIFQFLPYQIGDENISIDNSLISSNFNDAVTTPSSRKLLKIINSLGQSITNKANMPLYYIYDDGSVDKKIIFDKN